MTAPLITREELATLCSTDPSRPQLAEPFAIYIGAELWSVATNGWRLLAIRADLQVGVDASSLAQSIRNFHAEAFENGGVAIETRELRAFFEQHAPPAPGTCEACKGAGSDECEACDGEGTLPCECVSCGHGHEVTCTSCNGDGSFRCPRCRDRDAVIRVDVGVGRFNAAGAAPLARLLPDGTAQWRQAAHDKMATIAGAGWFAVLMPLRIVGDDAACPRFDVGLAQVTS